MELWHFSQKPKTNTLETSSVDQNLQTISLTENPDHSVESTNNNSEIVAEISPNGKKLKYAVVYQIIEGEKIMIQRILLNRKSFGGKGEN